MIEEMYYFYKSIDITDLLFTNGYIAGYNVPYDLEIYNVSNYEIGWGSNYTHDPRAIIFRGLAHTT